MKEALFRELCGEGRETLEVNGKGVPALISTCTDEQTVMAGGILARTNYTARVCAFDIAPLFASELPGKVVFYGGAAYRVLQAKKHPRSDVIHLLISEK